MTPTDFRSRLRALNLTLAAFATMTGIHPTTVQYWGRDRPGNGVRPFPPWVALLMGAWEKIGYPNDPAQLD